MEASQSFVRAVVVNVDAELADDASEADWDAKLEEAVKALKDAGLSVINAGKTHFQV